MFDEENRLETFWVVEVPFATTGHVLTVAKDTVVAVVALAPVAQNSFQVATAGL